MITILKRYTALAGALILVLLGLYLYLRVRYGKPANAHPAPVTILPSNDKEQILVDPVRHTLIVVKPTGNTTLTLPDHLSTVDIRKDGTVQITSPQWGFEHRPFIGVHVSDHFRVAAGLDGYYFKKLDIGGGAACRIGNYTPILFGQLSYNFYSNCRAAVSYGTNKYIGGTLTVRI